MSHLDTARKRLRAAHIKKQGEHLIETMRNDQKKLDRLLAIGVARRQNNEKQMEAHRNGGSKSKAVRRSEQQRNCRRKSKAAREV